MSERVEAEGGRTEEERTKLELETLTEGSVERWVDSNRIPVRRAVHNLNYSKI